MRLLFAIALTVVVGCGKSDPTVPVVSQTTGPTHDQITKDLVGQTFFYQYGSGAGGSKWTIKAGEIIDVPEIKERSTDSNAGIEEVEVCITLFSASRSPSIMIQGSLIMVYKKFDQGWKVQSVWPKAGGRPPIAGGDWGGKSFSWGPPK